MNCYTRIALTTLLAFVASAAADELTWLYGGVNSFQDCSRRDQVVRGLCGSGKNRDCKRNGRESYTSTGCGDFPAEEKEEEEQQEAFQMASSASFVGLNNWHCETWGKHFQCPAGFVIVGVCGSGQHEDCREYCNPHTHAAYKCAPAPGGQGVDSGRWSQAQKWGRYYQCPANEVVCGACQSGVDANCNGGHFRVKCCAVGDYDIVGRWNYVRTVVGDTTETLRHGTTKTSSETKSKEWSLAVTKSVEAGFKVKGVGVTSSLSIEASFSYASQYSEEWSSSQETEFTFFLDKSDRGKALWQWVFDISDPYSNQVLSRTMDYALTEGRNQPPRCQPGFSEGTTVDYQRCTSDDRILPGYSPLPEPLVEYQEHTGKACRTASLGKGTPGTDFSLLRNESRGQCRELCSEDSECKGWEYSNNRCELWWREPEKFERNASIDCYVKV